MKKIFATILAVMMLSSISVSAGSVALSKHDAGKLFGKHAAKHVKVIHITQKQMKKAEGKSYNAAMGALVGGASYAGYHYGRRAAGGNHKWSWSEFSNWAGWGAILSWF